MRATKTLDNVQNENRAISLNMKPTHLKPTQMMMKIFILCSALILLFGPAHSQTMPSPYYRQFSFNPYLLNPGYVGINNTIEADMVYRKQMANFKDAPSTVGASLQLPTSDRVALGFNVFTDKQVLLKNSNFTATFGYVVPIAKNQTIRFGLSGGIGMNKLDLSVEEMNTQDPLIAKSVGTNYYIDGNFGVVYTNQGLRLGFALTDLFKSSGFTAETFNKFKMSNLKNRLVTASYRFDVGMMKDWSIEPYAMYRQSTDGAQNYWEVATLAYYKQNIWSGASYNKNKGIALIFGATVKEKFRFSYSYEFAPFGSNLNGGGAHELHIGIRLPSKKVSTYAKAGQLQNKRQLANEREVAANDLKKGQTENEVVLEEAIPTDSEEHKQRLFETEAAPSIANNNVSKAPAKAPASKPVPAGSTTTNKPAAKKTVTAARESFTMTKGHNYVVIGAFKQMGGSMTFVKSIKDKGYKPSVALNPKNNLYYVYIFSSKDMGDTKKKRNEYKLKNLFKEAWIFTME